jgi:hypothetical protein
LFKFVAGLDCDFHARLPAEMGGLSRTYTGSKAAEALRKPLHKILPTMPNKPDGCRLLPTYPLDSVESDKGITNYHGRGREFEFRRRRHSFQ